MKVWEQGTRLKHFKGNLYTVVTMALEVSSDKEIPYCVYTDGNNTYCRPVSNMQDIVVNFQGKRVQRFVEASK